MGIQIPNVSGNVQVATQMKRTWQNGDHLPSIPLVFPLAAEFIHTIVVAAAAAARFLSEV